MYMYIHICMYVCVCICMYVCMCAYIYIYICIKDKQNNTTTCNYYIHQRLHMESARRSNIMGDVMLYIYIYIYMHVHINIYIYIERERETCICMYVYIYIYIYTYCFVSYDYCCHRGIGFALLEKNEFWLMVLVFHTIITAITISVSIAARRLLSSAFAAAGGRTWPSL